MYTELYFDWDENKNRKNINKHNISFEEAVSVFFDEDALVKSDPDHSDGEDRFIILGKNLKADILVICHCYRKSDRVIRLISARKAVKSEVMQYWQQRYF